MVGVGAGIAVKRALSAQQSPLGIVQAGVSCLKREGLKLGKILIDENKSGPLVASLVFLLIVAVVFIRWRRKDKVFLLDFECFKTQKEKHVSYQRFEQGSRDSGFFTQEALDFQTRMLSKSGLSEETCFPMGLHKDPPISTMTLARQEAEEVIFSVVENLFERTGLRPRDIDVVVVNCSLFNPTPSLSAMIVNKFKMRTNVEAYSLGGMGCSAGIIAIGLAKRLLSSLDRKGYALVVSTENITQNWYQGNERSMLIPNTIFRMGSAAMILTNKKSESARALYELEHVVRVHLGAQDDAFACVYQREDSQGKIGVELNKDLVKVAARAMEANLTRLGPLVLPVGEKLAFALNWFARKILRMKYPAYIPKFRKAFDHFCLHAGGRAVVTGLSKQLGLPKEKMAPSANALHWYGNTSSSTVWYSFSFIETFQGVCKGDRVWQIGFGSGFKCNSAVWKALRRVKRAHSVWEHVIGREDQAVDTILKIEELSARERTEKQKKGDIRN
jgi:3-ketoacyl-CoA synthase